MNSSLVVYEMSNFTSPVEDNWTIQLDLVDMSRRLRTRFPVYITLNKSRSAELFAEELREAANDIERFVKEMSRGDA